MSTSISSTHLPPIGAPARDETGASLQSTLVELIDLSLAGKQLHWSVVGPQFRPLHLQLDELIDEWREMADTVAERAVALDVFPDGQASAVVAGREDLEEVHAGAIPDHEVVRDLAHRIAVVVEHTRARMDRIGDLDLASQDVLIEVVRGLEKQLWMVRAQLPVQGG
jgi:starvation-inducible DNA-binding protein